MIHTATDFDLRPRNTFGLRASCSRWIEYTSDDDIPSVIAMLDSDGSPWFHFGAGSNLLIATDCFAGSVLHSSILTHEVEPLSAGRVRVLAGAGITMDSLCEWACQSGLWGLENLSAIPGEVGASSVQNVGAYGCEAADLIESVRVYDTVAHCFRTLSRDELSFGYRMSLMKQPGFKGRFIVSQVSYILSVTPAPKLDYGNLASELIAGEPVTPMAVREAVIRVRNRKLPDPAEIGSAGSFFKNPVIDADLWDSFERRVVEILGPGVTIPRYPAGEGRVKLSAAWLIDRAGCKAMKSGGASVWQKQPLVLINATGHAVFSDIDNLCQEISDTVFAMFGIRLNPEVERVC